MGLYPRNLNEYAAQMGIPRSVGSKAFLVDYVNGSDSNTGTNWRWPLKTIEYAYSLCTTLKNDVIFLVANGTSNVAAAALVWAKDFTHLVGLGPAIPDEQRSRIKCGAALATTPFVTWSGDGCIVKNISFWHETSDALGLVAVSVTGGRNLFESVQFAGAIGTNNATGACSLKLSGTSCSGNYFKNCTIGNDTVQLVTGVDDLELAGAPAHNTFDDCIFAHSAGAAANAHIRAAAAADVGRRNIFRRCLFLNEYATTHAQTEVYRQGGGAVSESSRVVFMDCAYYGSGTLQNANSSCISNGVYATAIDGAKAGSGHMVIVA